jgi:hypothetical protein
MWRGTVHFRVIQAVPYKSEIQLHDAGDEPCIYIKQITTEKGMYMNFTLFKTKYVGLGVRL